jgi:hypothetical protein
MYTRLFLERRMLLHHSKIDKPRAPEPHGHSKEFSHHGA